MNRGSWLGVALAAVGCLASYGLWLNYTFKHQAETTDIAQSTLSAEECEMRICGDDHRRMKTFHGDECPAIRNSVAIHGNVRMCWADGVIKLENGVEIIPSFGQTQEPPAGASADSTGWHYEGIYATGGYVGRSLSFCGQGDNRKLIPTPTGEKVIVEEGDALLVDTASRLPVCINPFSIDTLFRHGRR